MVQGIEVYPVRTARELVEALSGGNPLPTARLVPYRELPQPPMPDFSEVKGQENAYKEVIKTAVGGAAGVVHQVDSPTTDCQPNDNVEAMRVFMLSKKVECRPVWKPMHKQPVYADAVVYTNGIEEDLFKIGMCLPAGPYVTDDDVRYIVDCIKEAIEL